MFGNRSSIAVATCIAAFAPIPLSASPLTLNYSITALLQGTFEYQFNLVLDNHDGTWLPGDNFNMIVFGESRVGPSHIADFVGNIDSLPIGPFQSFGYATGASNGPGFFSYLPTIPTGGWVPTAIGESLAWSGTSSTSVAPGQMRFSAYSWRFEPRADFELASLVAVPEPATSMQLLIGLALAAVSSISRINRKV